MIFEMHDVFKTFFLSQRIRIRDRFGDFLLFRNNVRLRYDHLRREGAQH